MALSALVWAWWPVQPDHESAQPRIQAAEPNAKLPEEPARGTAFPAEAFRVVLWPQTANEVADQRASSNTPPPQPPDYVLIAILTDVGTGGPPDGWKAVLYDPAVDRLHTVASGDRVGRFEVSVAGEVVQLTDGAIRHELRLRETRTTSEGAVRG